MESVREAVATVRSTADLYFDKTVNLLGDVSKESQRWYEKVKNRSQVFVETGVAHYQQTEEMALGYFKDGIVWCGEHQTFAYVMAGTSAVVLLPGLRRSLLRRTLGPFRSDESIYRSAEAKLQSVQENLKHHQQRTEKLTGELKMMIDTFTSAQRSLRNTGQELNSFSNQIHKDVRMTYELLRDMKEMPSRPSLKMQSDAAVTLSNLERQNRQVDDLLYKVMQKGI